MPQNHAGYLENSVTETLFFPQKMLIKFIYSRRVLLLCSCPAHFQTDSVAHLENDSVNAFQKQGFEDAYPCRNGNCRMGS